MTDYRIELNENMDPEKANAFLMRDGVCVGGVDLLSNEKWQASIDAPFDEATGSDVEVLGEFDTQADAISALWRARERAAVYVFREGEVL